MGLLLLVSMAEKNRPTKLDNLKVFDFDKNHWWQLTQ